MSAEDSDPPGPSATLRRIVESVVALLHNRVQLIAVEWQEERHRAVALLLRLGLVLSAVAITLALTVISVAAAVWLRWGLPGLWCLSALLMVVTAGLTWRFASWFNRQPPPFASTTAEFRKDREWLNKKS